MKKRTNRFNTGKPFEEELTTILTQYGTRGLLRLKKVEPPMRFAGRRIILLPNPFLDFCGSWTERGGRAVFMEAKSTSKNTLPVGKSGLTDSQVDSLRHWHNAGAVTFVLWKFDEVVRFIAWPWIEPVLKNRKHIKLEDCVEVGPGSEYGVKYDFIRTMRQLWKYER